MIEDGWRWMSGDMLRLGRGRARGRLAPDHHQAGPAWPWEGPCLVVAPQHFIGSLMPTVVAIVRVRTMAGQGGDGGAGAEAIAAADAAGRPGRDQPSLTTLALLARALGRWTGTQGQFVAPVDVGREGRGMSISTGVVGLDLQASLASTTGLPLATSSVGALPTRGTCHDVIEHRLKGDGERHEVDVAGAQGGDGGRPTGTDEHEIQRRYHEDDA